MLSGVLIAAPSIAHPQLAAVTCLVVGVITLTAIIVSLVVSVVVAGLSYGVNSALAPNIRKPIPSTRADQLRTIQKDNTAPLRIVYGTYRASGVLLFARSVAHDGTSAVGGPYLHFALAIAHGPIADLYDIQLDSDPAQAAKFGGLVAFVPFMGSADQAMFKGPVQLQESIVAQLPTEWLAANRPLRQVAYVWGVLKSDPQVFPGGAPNVRVTIQGRLLYDPRQDVNATPAGGQLLNDSTTWRWSNNWALCVYDFLRSKDYGLGIDPADIDTPSIIDAANLSDELIDAPSGTDPNSVTSDNPNGFVQQVARYTCDGLFETDELPIDVLGKLLTAGAGSCLFYGGQWHLKGGASEPTAIDATTGEPIELTPDDLRDDANIEITMLPGRQSRINTVRATFVNPAKQYILDDVDPVTDQVLLEQDGNVDLSQQLQLDFTQQLDRAAYVAGIFLREARMGRFVWPGKPTLTQIIPKSVVMVTHPWLGWDAKLFRIENRTRNPDGGIDLELAEYTDANYVQYDGPIGIGANLPQATDLPSPFVLDPPTSVAATEVVDVNPDGSLVAAIRATWQPPAGGSVDAYVVSWVSLASIATPQSQTLPGTASTYDIVGIPVGTYSVSVASRLNLQVSTYVAVLVSVTYITPPPPAPIDFRIVLLPNRPMRHLTWNIDGGIIPSDVKGFEVRWSLGSQAATDDAWNAAKLIAQTPALSLDTNTPVAAAAEGLVATYFTYFVRTLDRTNRYSTGLATLTVSLLPDDPDVLIQHEFSEEGWPGTIADGQVNSEGHLEGLGKQTWADWASWLAAGSWGAGGGTLIYTTPIFDLGADQAFTIVYQVGYRGSTARADIASRLSTDTALSSFRTISAAQTARFVQFRVTAYPNSTAPVIEKFSLVIHGVLDETAMQNVLGGGNGSIQRVEQLRGDWTAGPWSVNIYPVPGPPPNYYCTIEPESSWELDGSSMYATAAVDLPALQLQSAFTIECVAKFDSLAAGGEQVIVGRGSDWQLVWNNGDVYLKVNGTAVPGLILLNTYAPVVHLAYTYSGGVLNAFKNGVKLLSYTAGSLGVPVTPSTMVTVGADNTGSKLLQGKLEELRIWSVALSADEIAEVAGVSVDATDTRLAAYWRMDEGTGATIHDRRQTVLPTCDLAITGTPVWIRMAYRESPYIPLDLLPVYDDIRINYFLRDGTGTVVVEVSPDDGVTWTTVPGVLSSLSGLTKGESYSSGFHVRTYLYSSDPTQTPAIVLIKTRLLYRTNVGDLIVQPTVPYAVVQQASLQAIQGTGHAAAWSLVQKDAVGARFYVYDAVSSSPIEVTADVLFRGAKLA